MNENLPQNQSTSIEERAWPTVIIPNVTPDPKTVTGPHFVVPPINEDSQDQSFFYNRTQLKTPDRLSESDGVTASSIPLNLSTCTLLARGWGLEADHIGGKEEGAAARLAWILSDIRILQPALAALTNAEGITELLDELIPTGGVRSSLRQDTQMVTFEQIVPAVGRHMAPSDLPPSSHEGKIFRAVIAELIARVLNSFIPVQRAAPVTMFKWNPDLAVSEADLSRAVLAREIRRQIEAVSVGGQAAKVSFSVLVSTVRRICASLSIALAHALDRVSYASEALSVLRWYVLHPIVGGFPSEMAENPTLRVLASNATLVRLALKQQTSRLNSRTTLWAAAITSLSEAVSDASYFTTLPLASLSEACGHAHVHGAAKRLLGCMVWLNTPGSNASTVYIPLPVDKQLTFGYIAPVSQLTADVNNLGSRITQRDTNGWIDILGPLVTTAVSEKHRNVQDSSRVVDIISLGIPAEIEWLYAASLCRSIELTVSEPTLQSEGTAEALKDSAINAARATQNYRLDFLVHVSHINASLARRNVGGLLRTSNHKIVFLAADPKQASKRLDLVGDTLPDRDVGQALFFLSSINHQRNWGQIKEGLTIKFDGAGTYEWAPRTLAGHLNTGVPITAERTQQPRAWYHLNGVVALIADMIKFAGDSRPVDVAAGAVAAQILIKDLALTTRGRDLMTGMVHSMREVGSSVVNGGTARSYALVTDFSMTANQHLFALLVGQFIGKQLGLMAANTAAALASYVVKGDYIAMNALSGERFVDLGDWAEYKS